MGVNMKSLGEIKQEREDKQSQLFKDFGVFFAFSNQQFHEGKTPLDEGDKYVSMGMGGYLPKSKLDGFLDGMARLNQWYKDEIKNNDLRRQEITYELGNHEAWYTGEIEDTLDALGPDYTREEVQAVFYEVARKMQTEER